MQSFHPQPKQGSIRVWTAPRGPREGSAANARRRRSRPPARPPPRRCAWPRCRFRRRGCADASRPIIVSRSFSPEHQPRTSVPPAAWAAATTASTTAASEACPMTSVGSPRSRASQAAIRAVALRRPGLEGDVLGPRRIDNGERTGGQSQRPEDGPGRPLPIGRSRWSGSADRGGRTAGQTPPEATAAPSRSPRMDSSQATTSRKDAPSGRPSSASTAARPATS